MRALCSLRQLSYFSKLIGIRNERGPLYRVTTASFEDRQPLLNFMRQNFYKEEPLRAGALPLLTDPNDESFLLKNIARNTVVLALKPDDTIIAAIIGSSKVPNLLQNMSHNYSGKWRKILDVWAHVDKQSNIFNRFNIPRSLHVYMLAVHRCYRGFGLSQRIIRELMAIGQKQRYQALSIDATSVFTACVCQKLGMQLVNTLPYKAYMDENGNYIFAPPPPHDAIRTYVLGL